jgi:hypothetical protein
MTLSVTVSSDVTFRALLWNSIRNMIFLSPEQTWISSKRHWWSFLKHGRISCHIGFLILSALSLLYFYFSPKDGGCMFLRNVGPHGITTQNNNNDELMNMYTFFKFPMFLVYEVFGWNLENIIVDIPSLERSHRCWRENDKLCFPDNCKAQETEIIFKLNCETLNEENATPWIK